MLRELTHSVDPWIANGIRFPAAAVCYWPVLIYFYRQGRLTRQVVRQCLKPAGCLFCGQILWAMSPYYLPASSIGFLVRMTMVFSILFAMVWVREERRLLGVPAFYFGLVASTIGFLLMSFSQDYSSQAIKPFGIVLMLVYSVIYGLYVVNVRLCLEGIHPLLSFGIICQFVSTGLLVLAIFQGDWSVVPTFSSSAWALLLGSSLAGIATTHALLFTAVIRLGASITSGVQNLTPFVTALLAAAFLHESLTSIQWLGGMAIVLGAVWLLKCHVIVEKEKRKSPGLSSS